MTTSRKERHHDRRVLLAAVVVPLVFALRFATFAWPTARLDPRNLPIGLGGPADATRPVERQLAHAGDGAFELHRHEDDAAAREAIDDREVYGAVVASADGMVVLTSSAASPLVAAMLQQAFAAPAAGSGSGDLRTVEVVPADEDDPRGAVLSSLILPLVLSSVIAGVFLTQRGRPGLMQTAGPRPSPGSSASRWSRAGSARWKARGWRTRACSA